tara:strand:+ start:905 stop:1372 length:468 start_codon:yes stop_codon:yes gene_type:complete
MNKVIFAAGCFWSIQESFDSIPGVLNTVVGYTGGNDDKPTYESVCSGETNHAEAIEIEFNSSEVSLQKLLDVFWTIHDPTTKDRQGPDIGTQYRSEIFYLNNEQKFIYEQSKLKMNQNKFKGKIVTEISKAKTFFPAEEYHQKYNKKMKANYGIS